MLLGYVFHTALPLPLEHHALRRSIQPCVCIYSSASNCCTVLHHLHTPISALHDSSGSPAPRPNSHTALNILEHTHSCSLRSLGDSVLGVYAQKRFADKVAPDFNSFKMCFMTLRVLMI